MKPLAIAGLLGSLALTVISITIASSIPNSEAFATPMLVLGLAGTAVVAVLWMARRLGFGRRPAQLKDTARLDAFIRSLVSIASDAHKRGVLTLADASIPTRRTLFSSGAQLVIRGDTPQDLRTNLNERAHGENQAEFTYRRSITRICRVAPLVCLSLGLVSVLMLLSMVGKVEHAGTPALFGLLFCVYASFAVAVAAQELGDRTIMQVAESELMGSMVIEALCAIRAGESPERVDAILRGLLPPPVQATENLPVRQAA